MTDWLILLCLLLARPGCALSQVSDTVSPAGRASWAVPAKSTFGQTFVAHHSGLESLGVYLSATGLGEAQFALHLRSSALDSYADVRESDLKLSLPVSEGWYEFHFTPIAASRDQPYYFFVDAPLPAGAALYAGSTGAPTFTDGALYLNGEAQDAQLAFKATYSMDGILTDVLAWLSQVGGVMLAGLFLFMLPGVALQLYLWPNAAASLPERLTLAIGVSLALYPVLVLWTNLVGLYFGPVYAWLPATLSVLALLWRLRSWRPAGAIRGRSSLPLADLALLLVSALVVLVRFFVIRGLEVPLWGDSYQHTMIAQLIVDHGGLFDSWQPYSDLQTFNYHFGFHVATAAFHWLSGWALPAATLWTGQIVNALAVIAVYPLATRVGGNRWAGVLAVLIAGLLSPMPMTYVNWGRYTQLAGQAILPAAVYLAWKVLESGRVQWRPLTLAALTIGGLSLTHYRILIFFVLFVLVFVLLNLGRIGQRDFLRNTTLLTLGAGVVFLPWLLHIFDGLLMKQFTLLLSTPSELTPAFIKDYNLIGNLEFYLPALLWLMIPFAIGLALSQRRYAVIVISAWWFVVLLAANPQWVHFPGEGILSNFAIFIAMYIPASILTAYACSSLAGTVGALHYSWRITVVALAFAALSIWGVSQRVGDIHMDEAALVEPPDLTAAQWLRIHTPSGAHILVNSFAAYGGNLYVGSDGGWWLPLLAGRQTILPPINYGSESGPRQDYREWINMLPRAVQTKGLADPDVLDMLKQRGIQYVYIGQRQGRVNYDGPDVLRPEALLKDRHFVSIYHQDRVWVLQLRE